MYELLPGDIVHLGIGDQVPADGLFLSGFALSIDESSLTGESEPVKVNTENPYLLSRTKVQDGSCKMLVVTVGMRTQWGKLMATLTEGENDETPLQVKLNGVTTIIGKIGLIFAIVTFAVLVQKLFSSNIIEGTQWSWSGDDALLLLEYFAIAVTIVVVAIPEVLPLAVTLSLAFSMKKMMNDKALVRNLVACETMGSATTICSDKTGTLTTNHMTVVKSCISMNVGTAEHIPDSAKKILEVVTERKATKVLRVEPFNSTKKQMGVVLELPGGGVRAHCKGASEIVLAACDNVIDENSKVVTLDDEKLTYFKSTVDGDDSELILNTLIFNCFVFCQLFNEDNSNEMEKENVLDGIWKNKVFVSVIAATVIF
ncbi:calcium-transporting ATPase 2, plasma membrane-type-like protein [Tanacetum coccineum]